VICINGIMMKKCMVVVLSGDDNILILTVKDGVDVEIYTLRFIKGEIIWYFPIGRDEIDIYCRAMFLGGVFMEVDNRRSFGGDCTIHITSLRDWDKVYEIDKQFLYENRTLEWKYDRNQVEEYFG